ncbi:MAG: TIM barrel protein [Pseudomonadota bacterium]
MARTVKLSANLGFLWTELSLPDAVRAAAAAGFEAVELHWPYGVPVDELSAALRETGLPVLGLNTRRGDTSAGENGLSALPGREADARAAIDEAYDYGARIGAGAVHVMAGFASGDDAAATFRENLVYAADRAAALGMGVLIEPLNRRDAPGYFLKDAWQAAALIREIGRDEIRIMFDCYHLQIMQGDLTKLHAELAGLVGHIQFAAVPSRAEPDEGELAYERLLPALAAQGYGGYFGAEYRPRAGTDAGLGWLGLFEGP